MSVYTNERDAAKEALEKFRRLETQVILQHQAGERKYICLPQLCVTA